MEPLRSDLKPASVSSTALPFGSEEVFRAIDRTREALTAQATGGFSPLSLSLAYLDWALHLWSAPGKQLELAAKALHKTQQLAACLLVASATGECPTCVEPLPGDRRFSDPAWCRLPYTFFAQAFLLSQQLWHADTHNVPGITPHHEDVVSFGARQLLDMYSPSNMSFLNPVLVEQTGKSLGLNYYRGLQHWLEDLGRLSTGQKPVGADCFRVGKEVAVTSGKVIYRNHLIELIQYAPTTPKVFAEPVLIVPAWIMKYYILDLSPHNSLVRYLVDKGHSVFCISWRNPDANDRDLRIKDYRRLGVMAALNAISSLLQGRKIHPTGYCLGGTLLAIAAAAMARSNDDRLCSLTLLAAQTDFTEPGELALFIDHSQMHMLDSMMWTRGYLSADQMAGAFQLLRSNDLIWSRLVREYLMGERVRITDLMAWNADSTRMPYRMHAEYLTRFYLRNELAAGSYVVDEHPISLENVRVPMFAVATEHDHVAPWRSVYKIHNLTKTEVTFLLTSGGHNAGIISEPGHRGRFFRVARTLADDPLNGPDRWVESAELEMGSWWPRWQTWLADYSGEELVKPPSLGSREAGLPPLSDAPGTYVLQR